MSRAMLAECLMILDHLSREVEQWTFETISQQGFDSNFKTSNDNSAWMSESSLIMSISGYFHPERLDCLYLLHPHPKIALQLL